MIVIADVHIGVTKPDKLLALTQLLQQYKDEPVLWLGDAFDIVMIEESYALYGHLIKDTDIVISGNHDYGLFDGRQYWIGDTYCVHGDLIDFGYIFGRLEQGQQPSIIESLVRHLRKWSLDDVYNFYDICYELTDDEVSYINIKKIKETRAYIKVLMIIFKVMKQLLQRPVASRSQLELLPPATGSGYLGYFTHDPSELFERVLLMYPDAINASTIVIGHTHYPCDVTIEHKGKQYRFITLGAWIGDKGTTYGRLTDDGLEVIAI